MARKIFENSVTPLPAQEGLTPHGLMVQAADPVYKEEKMTVLFSLSIPPAAAADLEEKVANGEVVSADQRKNYAPNAKDVETLVSWLKAQGFEIVQVSPDSASVYALCPQSHCSARSAEQIAHRKQKVQCDYWYVQTNKSRRDAAMYPEHAMTLAAATRQFIRTPGFGIAGLSGFLGILSVSGFASKKARCCSLFHMDLKRTIARRHYTLSQRVAVLG